jgi:hypothetical protein
MVWWCLGFVVCAVSDLNEAAALSPAGSCATVKVPFPLHHQTICSVHERAQHSVVLLSCDGLVFHGIGPAGASFLLNAPEWQVFNILQGPTAERPVSERPATSTAAGGADVWAV